MKKLLLSALLSVLCISTYSHAAPFGTVDRLIGGAVAGLFSAGAGTLAYKCIKGPRADLASPQFEGSFGFSLAATSAAAATLSAVLLNPTNMSSTKVAKLGTGFTFSALSLIAALKRAEVTLRPKKNYIEEKIDAGLANELTVAGALSSLISSVALYLI